MAEYSYSELIAQGFERVERDDRLLDVFPQETREKGIELWDKWGENTVEIIRAHVQGKKRMTKYEIPRRFIEELLRTHQIRILVPGVGVEPTNQ